MKPGRWILSFTLCLITLTEHAISQSAPRLLPFQGRLTDPNGAPLSDGIRVVRFRIFSDPTSAEALWPGELHRATINGGLVNVQLGGKTPFTGVDFDRQLYLEITVDSNGDNSITAEDPPLLPRQAILPVLFAKEAGDSRKLAGYDWLPLFGVNNPEGPLLSAKIGEGSLDGSKVRDETITTRKLAKEVADLLVPPGTIVAFGGGIVPDGWLLCDGKQAPRTGQTARLYQAIGTAWGQGDGSTTFHLPDLRGVFLRGVSGDRNDGFADPERDHPLRSNPFPGGSTGNMVGSFQQDQLGSHSHTYRRGVIASRPGTRLVIFADDNNLLDDLNYPTGINPSGGPETRPKNAYVNYIIKY